MLIPSSGSTTSRRASRTSASVMNRGGPGTRFQRHCLREHHVVLQVNVTMEIALEARELTHADRVRSAAVRWHHVSVRQLANEAQFVGSLTMFAFHHANWILHRPERTSQDAARLLRVLGQVADVGEQHLFLFEHMLRE